MKKLLLIALLMLTLIFTAVACTPDDTTDDTTDGDTTVGDVTEAPDDDTTETPDDDTTVEPGDDTTVEPGDDTTVDPGDDTTVAPDDTTTAAPDTTEEPETLPYKEPSGAGYKSGSFDTFYVNGKMYFEADGGAGDKLTAQNDTITFELGTTHDSMMLRGWVGFDQAIDSFGYYVNGYNFVFDASYTKETGTDVKNAGGEYASRYEILVPLADLGVGEHIVGFVVKLADGTVVRLRNELTVVIKGLEVGTDPFHTSVDFVNETGPDGAANYSGRGGTSVTGVDVIEGVTATIDGTMNVSIRGWFITQTATVKYVWSVDGLNWYDCGGTTSDRADIYNHALANIAHLKDVMDESAITNTGFNIYADLTAYDGQTVDVTFAGISAADETKVLPFVTIKGVAVPDLPDDIEEPFYSDVNSNSENTDLAASDLASYFTVTYGLGDPRSVALADGTLCYMYGGINELYTNVNGLSALKATIHSTNGCSYFFIRGTHAVNSVVSNDQTINNYYETDGLGLCGGAGIYARIENNLLTVVVKALDPTANYRIANKIYRYEVDSNELVMADDGSTVYIIVGDKLITTITLSGEIEYPEHFSLISPAITFAAKAEIVTATGDVEVIENTLVASTCCAQSGLAVRGGAMYFTQLDIVPFSAVTIPDEIYRAESRTNIALNKPASSDSVEGGSEQRVASMAVDGDDSTRYGAVPSGVAYLIVDLEKVYLVDTFQIHFENTVLGWTIYGSLDGEEYFELYKGGSGADRTEKITIDPTEMRYVKIARDADDGSGSNWFSIWELVIYAAPNPYDPTYIVEGSALLPENNTNPGVNGIASAVAGDGYITITPSTGDPYYYLNGGFVSDRYVVIKYRTSTADKANMQFFLGSTGGGPQDDSSMMQQAIVGDGEWHLAIFDTIELQEKGVYDGSYASYFRFDCLESGYVYDENGEPAKDATGGFIKLPLPEGADVDVAYVAFFSSLEQIENYEAYAQN